MYSTPVAGPQARITSVVYVKVKLCWSADLDVHTDEGKPSAMRHTDCVNFEEPVVIREQVVHFASHTLLPRDGKMNDLVHVDVVALCMNSRSHPCR